MSGLILPANHQNPVLEKNLNALFTRYPHERTRLEAVLRAPPPTSYQLPPVELPSAPSKPPIRILLLLGIVNPTFLATILNDPTVTVENFKLFIFEQNPEFLSFCFHHADLAQVINFTKTEWFLLQSEESLKPALFRALKPEGVCSMMLNVQALQTHAPQRESDVNYYAKVPQIYDETARHVLHNHGNTDDSLLGIEVTLRNKKYVLNAPGISDLKDYYQGCSALIVGAGPSLDHELANIKKYNDRFVVIAADAALKPLLAAGIRVDYTTSIERLNAYQKPFFENLEGNTADLVAFPVVHPDVLDLFPGNVRLVYRNYGFFAYFERSYPKGILRCGGSTSHLGVRLAAYMGCRRAFLIGLDSCYEERDGLFRSHCSGTGHPNWGEFTEIEEFAKSRRHAAPMKAKNNLGQEVTSNWTYYQWIKEYSEELAYVGQTMMIKNCAATGLAIDGVPFVPLETAAKDLDPQVLPKPDAIPAPITRNWDHKFLKKSFEGWRQIAIDSITECDQLLSLEEVNDERFDALFYLYNFRMMIDDLFVSFIIQACALEFFHYENTWWSLGLGHRQDLPAKLEVLKKRFQLFEKVLTRLIVIFEEERDGEVHKPADA